MLIDANHDEETRVIVLNNEGKVHEFDIEAKDNSQIRGNIYLAKVTRVEPSLQAAFVEYGGNRHGFLAFSEIHPDYYQIPKSERDKLLNESTIQQTESDASSGVPVWTWGVIGVVVVAAFVVGAFILSRGESEDDDDKEWDY